MSRPLLDDDQRRDWLRLISSENVGPITFRQLINRLGSAKEALEALPSLARRGGLQRPIRICSEEAANRIISSLAHLGARLVALGEPGYPPLLREIDSAPPLVCIKGNCGLSSLPTVAIVGARNASALGRKFARQIATELGRAGFVVVSGLARGIDTAAHEGSLDSGTAAVLAGGIDFIYPAENKTLQATIAEKGFLIAECMPGTIPKAEHFPRRNRIISGMSYGTVVVEAAVRSGSLITARFAGEQGREVFAVPGSPLDPRAGGTNRLLREGAILVESAQDIIEQLRPLLGRQTDDRDELMREQRQAQISHSAEVPSSARDKIIELLSPTPVDVDDLVRESAVMPSAVLALLLELELAGTIQRHTSSRVSLCS